MKVLILSITAGQGHNTTAAALNLYLESVGAECRILDTYSYLNKMLSGTVSKGYLLSVENAKFAYARVYKHLEKRKKNANQLSATRLTNMLFTKKMKKYIDIYDPDVIVCTHIFSGMIIDLLKQRHIIRAKTIGIVTDFTMHPYWEEGLHLDYVVIANENMCMSAKKKGFTDEQILPFGIPIHPKFAVNIPKEEARESIGLMPDKLTLLLMGGSMGYGHISETVELLDKIDLDFQIIIVCGSNTAVKNEIDKMQTKKKLINYGFTTNVNILMDAADCIISKPGGLTTSEALAKKLPIIMVNPIPGQEERNVQFLLNNGVAMAISDTNTLDSIIYELFGVPEKLEIMKRSIELIRKPEATKILCDFIMNMN